MNSLHSRVDLACEQLDVAIELFFASTSFVSSLTLAGAAEEILGTEVKNLGGKNALTRRYISRVKIAKQLKNKRLYSNTNFKLQPPSSFYGKLNYAAKRSEAYCRQEISEMALRSILSRKSKGR